MRKYCEHKKKYTIKEATERQLASKIKLYPYVCPDCKAWHVTTSKEIANGSYPH